MIQRIQSLYLLIVAVLTALMCFMPLGVIYDQTDMITLTGLGFQDASGNMTMVAYALAATVIVSALLALIILFLYKKRMAQFRLCVVEMILLAGVIFFELYYLLGAFTTTNPESMIYVKVAGVFPLVAMIFAFLAFRGVKKDIFIVKSLDRIR